MVRHADGFNYYVYVLIYKDNVVVIHNDAQSVLCRIYKYFKLNPSSIGDPDIYLGAKLNHILLENGVWAWENSPARYAKESVANVEKCLSELADARWKLPKNKAKNPFIGYYTPDMYETPAFEHDL